MKAVNPMTVASLPYLGMTLSSGRSLDLMCKLSHETGLLLTVHHLKVMELLLHSGGMTVGEIVRHSACAKPAVKQCISALMSDSCGMVSVDQSQQKRFTMSSLRSRDEVRLTSFGISVAVNLFKAES